MRSAASVFAYCIGDCLKDSWRSIANGNATLNLRQRDTKEEKTQKKTGLEV